MNDSEKYISGAILQYSDIPNVHNNTPIQYADRQTQYMSKRSRQFALERAKYASDYVKAEVQGISSVDFYSFFKTYIRLSDVHSSPTISQQTDDTKLVLFDEPKIEYFPIGAKIKTMGSTWICVNPSNLSSTLTNAVVRRCNTSYNLYDYYGNIITEPIILEKSSMLGNDNGTPQNLVLMDGYFNVICQLNDNTKKLGINQRLILGSKAYHITGFNDFYQEFSGDYNNTHILYFTVRIEEPTQNDDVPNHIANGKTYSFTAKIAENKKELNIGDTIDLKAIFFKRDGDNEYEVKPTEQYAVDWTWKSSDENILKVNDNGQAVAISNGTVQIIAVLAQNQAVTAKVELVVKEIITQPYIAFNGIVTTSIEQYDTATISATYYENGNVTDKQIEWNFSGAYEQSYTATIKGNMVEIYCVLADSEPLIVTASCEEKSISTNIDLLGY